MKVLDHTKKQNTAYCIPNWLRDEQVKLAIESVKGRIQPGEPRNEPVAIVCFGPSLNDTWEQVKNFKYIISCSGSHRYLINRGIIPTWHCEVDPRKHKIKLLGEPHKDVEYLIASTCHPLYFKHLEGYNVKLWHVFDSTEEAQRIIPAEEWAITGGCDVGLRSMTIAAFLGFKDLHIFGMDQSAGIEGKATSRHAAEHPNKLKDYDLCEYDGVKYMTTPGMLEAARAVWHELDMMPKVKATFYGEGLCQHMAKHYKPKENVPERPFLNSIAFSKPELISSTYRDLNHQLHKENLAYGVGGGKYADIVMDLSEKLKTKSVLDYGCGKGYLAKALPFPIWEYDPAISGKEELPRPADLVICTDVLEHIEPDKLMYVLGDLARCTRKLGYFVIHTGPSSKSLSDGRNAHLIQENSDWWNGELNKFFKVAKIFNKNPLLHVIVEPKRKAKNAAA